MSRWRIATVALLLTGGFVAAGPGAGPALAACAPSTAVDTPLMSVSESGFVPVTPVRIADTRNGIGAPTAPIDDGCVLAVQLTGVTVPAGATAVAVTVTSDRAAQAGYVTAYGCGSPRPRTSVLNPRPNDPTPNLLVVALDATRQLCFYSDHRTDLLVDITGWFTPTGDRLHEIAPVRALDTRANAGAPVAAGAVVVVPIGGTHVPAGSTAIAATVTLTQAGAPAYATAFPCGTAPPMTSTTNTLAGSDRGTAALVGLASDGNLCVFVSARAHLIVDVSGWFGDDSAQLDAKPGSPLAHLATTRLVDTRANPGRAADPLLPNIERAIDVLGSVPVGTTSVQLNLLVVNPSANGFLSAYPCGTTPAATSALNYRRAAVETALVTVPLGDNGRVCLVSSAQTTFVVDLFAGFGRPGALHALKAAPALDQADLLDGQLDHTLHCPAGGNVRFSIQAAPGMTASVDGGPALPGVQSVIRTLQPDGTITIRVVGALRDEQHLIRCLPNDFPRFIPTGKSDTPGWYVGTSLGTAGFAFILDEYGVPVWYQRTAVPMIGVWPLADGTLAWRRWSGGGFPGGNGSPEIPPLGFEIHDLEGNLLDTIDPVGGTEPLDWHELLELPGGGHLVVTYPLRNDPSLNASCTKSTGGTLTNVVDNIVDSDLVELDATGTEVWRWSSSTHTDLSEMQIPICFQIAANPNLASSWALDYMHVNSVERLDDGDYLIGARHFNSIERIDRASGDIVWKLGGSAPLTGTLLDVRGPSGTPATAGQRPAAPHDARISPTGTITVHDNHLGGVARASEFEIDAAAGTATLIWQFTSPNAGGATLGSVRRQPDGATVIAWGEGHAPWLQEVDSDGTIDLEIDLPSPELIYRGIKVPAATWTRAELRSAAGGQAD